MQVQVQVQVVLAAAAMANCRDHVLVKAGTTALHAWSG
jgi:hypothetical protein